MAPNSTRDAVDSVERFTVFAGYNRQNLLPCNLVRRDQYANRFSSRGNLCFGKVG